MNSFSPMFNNPFTDFSFILAPHFEHTPHNSLCSTFEMRFMDCLEAYGSRKAYTKCADLVFDMHECRYQTLQYLRAKAIYDERMRQYRAGKLERPFEQNPPLDSYLYLT